LGELSWELGELSWELGVLSWELGVTITVLGGKDWNLEFDFLGFEIWD